MDTDTGNLGAAYQQLQDALEWLDHRSRADVLFRPLDAMDQARDLVTYALEHLDSFLWAKIVRMRGVSTANLDAADELIERAVQDFDSKEL